MEMLRRTDMRQWSDAEDHSALPVGFIIGMEGADPILWPEQVHEWWEPEGSASSAFPTMA